MICEQQKYFYWSLIVKYSGIKIMKLWDIPLVFWYESYNFSCLLLFKLLITTEIHR